MLNKLDLLPPDEHKQHCDAIVAGLNWRGPVYSISAATGKGTRELASDIMSHMENMQREREEQAARDRAKAQSDRQSETNNTPSNSPNNSPNNSADNA